MNPSQPVLGSTEAPADAQINPSGDARRLLMKLCTHILQQLTTDWPIPVAHQQSAPPPVVIKASAAAQDTKPDSAQLNEAWQLLHSRSLQDDPIVAIWLRGLCPRGVNIVLGAGLTITGYRRILGLVACYPENVSALASFVQSLSDRGLSAASGLLCVLPSSTGLQSAVRQVFGPRVAIQRCLNTLLDQVTCGLPEDLVPVYRNRLRQAWNGFDAREVESLLQDLLHRGFTHTDKLLVQVDGSRGLRKGIGAVFGDAVVFQRCQWHKRTNVTRHIKNEPAATHMKRRLQAAWELPTYKEARAALVSLHGALQRSYPKAARSLEEGLEDTLTLHRLGVRNQAVRDSLKTTNIIENLNSVIANRSRNVKRWRSSGMRQRWCGAIFMQYESNLKPIRREDMKELTQVLSTSGGRWVSGDSVCQPQRAAKATPAAGCRAQ